MVASNVTGYLLCQNVPTRDAAVEQPPTRAALQRARILQDPAISSIGRENYSSPRPALGRSCASVDQAPSRSSLGHREVDMIAPPYRMCTSGTGLVADLQPSHSTSAPVILDLTTPTPHSTSAPEVLDFTTPTTSARSEGLSHATNVDLTTDLGSPVIAPERGLRHGIVDLTVSDSDINPEPTRVVDGTATLHNVDVLDQLHLQCSVCLDTIDQLWSTKCGHVYCKECIYGAIAATRRCPLCKQNLRPRDVHRLFLWTVRVSPHGNPLIPSRWCWRHINPTISL